ncbi:MAG: ornithine cyclodeaminase family protein [Candidatus Bathyarchaeota archaeon]|nr:ornithine cyclodeaminase family protein [Candidatus Bathyarchaeota archaeon]
MTDNQVKDLLTMPEVISQVESAFKQKASGHVQMPAKAYLTYRKYNGDLRTMPSYLEELDVSAVKLVNVHPDNHSKFNLPTVMATVTLFDPANGFPLAIMGGTTLTDMRTGAAGGVAAKFLAKKNSKTVALIGAGAQSRTQLMALFEVFKKFEEIRIWSRHTATEQVFLADAEKKYGHLCKFILEKNVDKTVEGADIVVTATPSREPLVSDDMIAEGTHINTIGADAFGKEELDPLILKRSKFVIDDWEQISHTGQIDVPLMLRDNIITREDVWAEIGEVVSGMKAGRTSDEEITVFVSTGLAVQDAVTAKIAYDKALKKGIGSFVKIV